jgi:tetratricopeptide (TPR) repeat protein
MSGGFEPALKQARELARSGQDLPALDALVALVAQIEALQQPDAEAMRMRAHALATRGEVLLRRGELAAALQALARAAMGLAVPGGERDLLYCYSAMAFCCLGLNMPEQGLQAASAAARIALQQGRPAAQAQALAAVGLCSGLLGDAVLAERYTLEALGTLLQHPDDGALRMCLINLVHQGNQEADHFRAQGRNDLADAALLRATRHVRRGEQLGFAPGSHGLAQWRGNRAGWLRRRGLLDEAEPELLALLEDVVAGGWVGLEREALLNLGELARARGDAAAARRWLERCVNCADAPDAFELVSRAHELLADDATREGDAARAAVHRQAHAALVAQQGLQRAAALSRLSELDQAFSAALSAADRQRLDAEVLRLRGLQRAPGGAINKEMPP